MIELHNEKGKKKINIKKKNIDDPIYQEKYNKKYKVGKKDIDELKDMIINLNEKLEQLENKILNKRDI